MEIQIIKKNIDSEGLREFVNEMFENWLKDSCFTKENSCCPGRTKNQILDKIKKIDGSNYQFVIALDENKKVCGMLYMSFFDNECTYIGLINVHPSKRRCNVFKQLLAEVIKECVAKQSEYIRLHTWEGNVNAINIFKKCGFIIFEKDSSLIEMRKYF